MQAHPKQTSLRDRKELTSVVFRDPIMEKGTTSQVSFGPSYEVFLSFRGVDTRYGFTDCLYHNMIDAGIIVFRDNESLHVGKQIGCELLRAIENSKIYIPIFSENYASSHWCLRELAHMVECTLKSNGNKQILPIFLNVEPADVKLKTNLYKQALSKRQKTLCTEVESWEKALTEVGNIKGWNWKKDEGQGALIRSILQTVLAKLKVAYENVTEHLVGVDDRVEAIVKKLDMGSSSVQFLGICGIGGVGKTTLAKVIFNKLSSSFHRCCFLADVGESSRRHGLEHLQKQLLSKLAGDDFIDKIYQVNDGINIIKRGVLKNRKVLVVFDNVDEKVQLKSLVVGSIWFGIGSRIIITTRNQSVLAFEGEATGEGPTKKPTNVSTYHVGEMEFGHALKLFSKHAFRRDSPPDHYSLLSTQIVSTLGKLPLSLEIIGSSLSGKPKALWEDTWKKIQKAPPMEVQKTLMLSYDRLDNEQKQVFLDIACFFIHKDKTYPFYMWDDCGYYPHDAIEVLCLMSLVKIKDNNTFWMHDQVRDLGREIIRRENFKYPHKRSRVWNRVEALSILQQKTGSNKIEALSLEYMNGDILSHDKFANLQNLRFFRGDGMFLFGDFNNLLPSLIWLSWHYCPLEFMATNFNPTNLVILDLSRSNISEEWGGWNQIKVASKLKVIDLSYCNFLKRTPDVSTLVSLERLTLKGCFSLMEIDPSIGKLKLLTFLNLDGCDCLQEFPEELGCLRALPEIVLPFNIKKLPDSIGGLMKLRLLSLYQCTKIEKLPESVGQLQSLVELHLSRTSIRRLPDSIGNLKQLKVLKMRQIRGMVKLPTVIGLVEKLEELDLSFSSIFKLPTTVSRLFNLQTLTLDRCLGLKQLPELPLNLNRLLWTSDSELFPYMGMPHELEGVAVRALPTSFCTLSHLKALTLCCKNMQFLPQLPSSLRKLELRYLTLSRPLDFSSLEKLSILTFYNCSMPEFSGIFGELEVLRMDCCTFGKLDALFQLEMERLRSLAMLSCGFLPEVLDLSRMKNLQDVNLLNCHLLVEICGLENLGSLCFLRVEHCSSMERMSDVLKLRKLKKRIVEDCPKLRSTEGLNYLGVTPQICI